MFGHSIGAAIIDELILFCHIVKEFGLHIRKAYSLTYIQRSDNGHGHSSTTAGVDPGFQVKLKKIAPSGGRREQFWGISCGNSRFYAKKIIFFPILGGRAPGAPPWIRP